MATTVVRLERAVSFLHCPTPPGIVKNHDAQQPVQAGTFLSDSPPRCLLQGETKCELFDAKHESHLLHLDGQLSYDPKPYGIHTSRFHIKTMQVIFGSALAPHCTSNALCT